ncbi:MAG: flagellar M-ring protein FliF [Roseburia sp.]|nr:flagellar M-ring protein FliF [Roseburia sp.]
MVDKVLEFGKKILDRVKEWWNKFQPKQKTLIIGIGVALLLAATILIVVLSWKHYTPLVTCEDAKEASAVKALLDEQGLTYEMSSDGLNFEILDSQEADASLLLGANNIQTDAYTMDDVLNGGFSTTEADKQKRYKLYKETRMEEHLEHMEAVTEAVVDITIPDDNGTLIAQNLECYAGVILTLNPDVSFTEENAAAMARFVATALGNDTTDNITITDNRTGNLLFPIEQAYSTIDKADNMMMLKQEAESLIKNEVKQVLLGTNEFNQIEVAPNIIMDFSQTKITTHNYSAPEDHDQGMYAHQEIQKSTTTDGVGDVPGTDSNSESGYDIDESSGSTISSYYSNTDYLPDEKITEEIPAVGTIVYNNSTISVSAVRFRIVREEDVELQGFLDGITWEEYKLANDTREKIEVDEDLVSLVANATGVPTRNVTIVAYEEVHFVDRVTTPVAYKDIIQIVLIVIILLLLAFVVFMSLRTKREVEEEEELSVEDLLQSGQQDELESIETEQKSEARRLIENFVEENPEAVATLLRNWLDEDWG